MHVSKLMLVASIAASLVTPAAAEDTMLASGRAEFVAHCGSCHGEDAKGHGPNAAALSKAPADLTHIAARHGGTFPEDLVFETIAGLDMPDAHGTRAMPVWGEVFVSEAIGQSTKLEDAMKASDGATRRIESLVTYLKSIQATP